MNQRQNAGALSRANAVTPTPDHLSASIEGRQSEMHGSELPLPNWEDVVVRTGEILSAQCLNLDCGCWGLPASGREIPSVEGGAGPRAVCSRRKKANRMRKQSFESGIVASCLTFGGGHLGAHQFSQRIASGSALFTSRDFQGRNSRQGRALARLRDRPPKSTAAQRCNALRRIKKYTGH